MNDLISVGTGSLILRRFSPADAPKVFLMSREAGMIEWIPDQVYEDEAEAASVLDYLIKCYSDPGAPRKSPYVLGVCLKSTGELIGHAGLSPAGGQVEIGYAVESRHQGKGYATEAVAKMSDWGLEEFGLPSVLGIVASRNAGSCRVLEKAGFELTGESLRPMHGKTILVKAYQKIKI